MDSEEKKANVIESSDVNLECTTSVTKANSSEVSTSVRPKIGSERCSMTLQTPSGLVLEVSNQKKLPKVSEVSNSLNTIRLKTTKGSITPTKAVSQASTSNTSSIENTSTLKLIAPASSFYMMVPPAITPAASNQLIMLPVSTTSGSANPTFIALQPTIVLPNNSSTSTITSLTKSNKKNVSVSTPVQQISTNKFKNFIRRDSVDQLNYQNSFEQFLDSTEGIDESEAVQHVLSAHAEGDLSTSTSKRPIQVVNVENLKEISEDLSAEFYKSPVNSKTKRPYRHTKLISKRASKGKNKRSVSDYNTSEDEETNKETQTQNKRSKVDDFYLKDIDDSVSGKILDQLHEAIFPRDIYTEDDSDCEETVQNLSRTHVPCPGAGVFEARVGPGQQSTLSLSRSGQARVVDDALCELYKISVLTPPGVQAETNIFIPVPKGHEYAVSREEVPFTHVAHDDTGNLTNANGEMLQALAKTQLKLRKTKDQLRALRRRYVELLNNRPSRPHFSTMADLVGAAAKFLTPEQLVFFYMQLKAGAKHMRDVRYSVREKVFALSLYEQSPESYCFLRTIFDLPSQISLDKWLKDLSFQDPSLAKKLMYQIYNTYKFNPLETK